MVCCLVTMQEDCAWWRYSVNTCWLDTKKPRPGSRLSYSIRCGLFFATVAVTAHELVHATGSIHQFGFSRVERVGGR